MHPLSYHVGGQLVFEDISLAEGGWGGANSAVAAAANKNRRTAARSFREQQQHIVLDAQRRPCELTR